MARRRFSGGKPADAGDGDASAARPLGAGRLPPFLAVGRIQSPYGLRGEVHVEILTDFPDRFRGLEQIYLGEPPAPVSLERVRRYRGELLVKLSGYDDRTAAQALCNQMLWVPASEAMPLGEDEYYVSQIEGLEVWTTGGEHIGAVSEVLFTGSNDVYVVARPGGGEVLIPALADVVQTVDLESSRIIIEPMPGLLD